MGQKQEDNQEGGKTNKIFDLTLMKKQHNVSDRHHVMNLTSMIMLNTYNNHMQ